MKILFYSDSPALLTGMGIVIKELADRFQSEGHEVVCAGWHHTKSIRQTRYKVYNIDKNSKEWVHQLRVIIEDNSPDYVICLGDLFNFIGINSMKYDLHTRGIKQPKYILYLNVDSAPISITLNEVLLSFDKIITTSNFGKNTLSKIYNNNIDVVYHGSNSTYRDRDIRKNQKTFNIIINGRNTSRKNIMVSLEAFSIFAKNKIDVKLNLVTRLNDSEGFNLKYFLIQYNIDDKVNKYQGSDSISGLSNEDLNILYNSSHIFLSSSMGEGFGIPILESMNTGCIPICTDYSSMTELVKDRGSLIPVVGWMYSRYCQKLAVVDSNTIAKLLDKYYTDWKMKNNKLIKMGQDCIKWSTPYTWDRCFNAIKESISNIPTKHLPIEAEPYPVILDLKLLIDNERLKIDKREFIGVIKMGGLGDTLQLIPTLSGIRNKHPKAYIVVILENGLDLLSILSIADKIIEIKGTHYLSILKTVIGLFDKTYDVRYVSRVYGDENTEFSDKYIEFYNGWAFSNNLIRGLNKHVIDIMIESLGLSKYVKKIKYPIIPITDIISTDKYVVLHNSTGSVGNLKSISKEEIYKINKHILSLGYMTVQLGTSSDDLIEGISIDLRDKATMQQLPSIVFYAKYYIGLEGFLYHLAHFVGTKSIVWCTCTPPECFVYQEDTLLYNNKCHPCWWNSVTGEGWWHKCYMNEARCLNLPQIDDMLGRVQIQLEKE